MEGDGAAAQAPLRHGSLTLGAELMEQLGRREEADKRRAARREALRLQQEVRENEFRIEEFNALGQVLASLPLRLRHEAMIPMGPMAFVPGKIERTNEILVDIGGGFFAWQSAFQAQRILHARTSKLHEEVEAARRALAEYGGDDEAAEPEAAAEPPASGEQAFGGSGEFRLSEAEAEAFHASVQRAPRPEHRVSDSEFAAMERQLEELAQQEAAAEEAAAEGPAAEAKEEKRVHFAQGTKPGDEKRVQFAEGTKLDAEDTAPGAAAAEQGAGSTVLGDIVEHESAQAAPAAAPEPPAAAPKRVSLFKQRRMQQQQHQEDDEG